ncbi:MAG: Fic family protein [Alphaproteobacteria bacterium]
MIEKLPLQKDFETIEILKKVVDANRRLAELKGIVKSIPNEEIIINTLALQESKDSSEIEQIITTHDEIFKSDTDRTLSKEAKEVQNYAAALKYGVTELRKKGGISNNSLIRMVQMIKNNERELRTTKGTHLKNPLSGEIIYTPPQDAEEIQDLMKNLERYVNDNALDNFDPLVRMAIIHYQFESIHPFYDGNGRVGRILNILYLILNERLDLPILYMSGYIIKTKSNYYKHLQAVRDEGDWESWIVYMLETVEQTAIKTTETVNAIKALMLAQKHTIRENAHKIYSQDLINLIFSHPYTKIEFLVEELGITRQTASLYLKKLEEIDILQLEERGKTKYYVNAALFRILKG